VSVSEIIVQGMACRPSKYIIRRFAEKEDEESTEELIDMSFDGFGLYWEADAVARCLKGMSRSFMIPFILTEYSLLKMA
jgi:dihydrodiol dehydrogenase / D-xylose 1-dehydrogenase (NADP)